jgi:hypothetical protein
MQPPTAAANARHVSAVSVVHLYSQAVPVPVGAVPPRGSTSVVCRSPARIGGQWCWNCGGRHDPILDLR